MSIHEDKESARGEGELRLEDDRRVSGTVNRLGTGHKSDMGLGGRAIQEHRGFRKHLQLC